MMPTKLFLHHGTKYVRGELGGGGGGVKLFLISFTAVNKGLVVCLATAD